MARNRHYAQSLGVLHAKIKESRVLLVGAGGIGCELLKNLVLTGFGDIHVIDLDTIDLSNLNRQFLFRHEHIKKPKAIVAKETAGKFNPNVKIEAYHANIKESQFNVDWFKSFALVFNALDNLDARRHVNRMCLAATVPLVESGTTGFKGQVQVIQKGKSECYDCNAKEVPKSFPVCTIRSTPSQPIHCIVWAKSYLLPELFGASQDEAPELDNSEDADNREEIDNLKQEAEALKRIRRSIGSDEFAQKIFDKVFKEDIERLRSMEDMWKSRPAPQALDYATLESESVPGYSDDQQVWTRSENFEVFKQSLKRLCDRLQTMQSEAKPADPAPVISFDKDDEDTLDFVAASANLRSSIFGIPTKSKFDIKQMAGNIIPAIATTNAMTASLCVMQAFKVLKQDWDRTKMLFLERSGARAMNSEALRPPNPDCAVCGIAQSQLVVDKSRATLADLVEDVLRSELQYSEEITVNNEIGTVYDPDLEDNLPKKLQDLGISDESSLTVIDDEEDNPRVNLQLFIKSKVLPLGSKPILLVDKPDIARRPKPATTDLYIDGAQEDATSKLMNGNSKRKREVEEAEAEEARSAKKGKTTIDSSGAAVIVADETDSGAIVID
ncbi:putative ubiquitin-like activating enzyme [Phaeomoniella chlamydospora]|uniref:Ubiquitin-activating enzyme E1-like n=1 Tax=Phaeomoniella chlamydospora TaxID=158046 RepID=A0A0G2EXX7_PHACM|nr:putative ubiquitin-like activating enzyme [Phaeomoniella chlamydospora]